MKLKELLDVLIVSGGNFTIMTIGDMNQSRVLYSREYQLKSDKRLETGEIEDLNKFTCSNYLYWEVSHIKAEINTIYIEIV